MINQAFECGTLCSYGKIVGIDKASGVRMNCNCLKANPSKTQTCAFHLNNREAGRKLRITWEGTALDHVENPVYLGVTLDRTLSYKRHIEKTKAKANSRNSIVRELANSKWGAHPSTIRTSGLALVYSVAEYASPVWGHSKHAGKLDPVLNETCRNITGCLKPTNVNSLYTRGGQPFEARVQ